jgi:predicted phage-related endonuclease
MLKSQLWRRGYDNRRCFIGGSDARIIMGKDQAALIQLWREKRGEAEPEDLSSNLVVQLGAATEELNRSWYERNTGRRVTHVQRKVKHSAIPWMAATLDGIVEGTEAVFESKFMLPWSFSEEAAAEKYMPQLQHNMWVTHLRTSAKSELKALMPDDAKEAIGHGVRAKRSKSGAVSFDVLESEAGHAPVQ